jgi:hypothetical protein
VAGAGGYADASGGYEGGGGGGFNVFDFGFTLYNSTIGASDVCWARARACLQPAHSHSTRRPQPVAYPRRQLFANAAIPASRVAS